MGPSGVCTIHHITKSLLDSIIFLLFVMMENKQGCNNVILSVANWIKMNLLFCIFSYNLYISVFNLFYYSYYSFSLIDHVYTVFTQGKNIITFHSTIAPPHNNTNDSYTCNNHQMYD